MLTEDIKLCIICVLHQENKYSVIRNKKPLLIIVNLIIYSDTKSFSMHLCGLVYCDNHFFNQFNTVLYQQALLTGFNTQ